MAATDESKPKVKGLFGNDEATIDEKGRVLVGKKRRDRLGEEFVVTLGDNGCIYAYPNDVWESIVDDVLSYDPTNQGRQQYTRLVLGWAEDEIKFDQQGRVVVPRKLRAEANLKDKIVLVGCGDRMEIWAEDEYEKYKVNPWAYGRERTESIQKAYREMKGLPA